jgi:hypothetical protein
MRPAVVGRLGRAGVVDGVILEVLRHRLTSVEQVLDLGMGDVSGHDKWTGQRKPCLYGVFRQLGADLVHRPGQVDPHHLVPGSGGVR